MLAVIASPTRFAAAVLIGALTGTALLGGTAALAQGGDAFAFREGLVRDRNAAPFCDGPCAKDQECC